MKNLTSIGQRSKDGKEETKINRRETIDTVELGTAGTDNRRKRRTAGAATSNLGLNV